METVQRTIILSAYLVKELDRLVLADEQSQFISDAIQKALTDKMASRKFVSSLDEIEPVETKVSSNEILREIREH